MGAADQGIMFVHVGKDDFNVGARHHVRHASDETEVTTPLQHLMPARLGKKLIDVRKNGDLWCLRPDVKTSRNGHSFVEFA